MKKTTAKSDAAKSGAAKSSTAKTRANKPINETADMTEPERLSTGRPDNSATRVLRLLDLFTVDQPVWTAEAVAENLDLHRSTAYRYVRSLHDTGFLAPAAGGGYVLGPRFVEVDRQIRLTDPLLKVGPTVMAQVRAQAAGAQLLCSFYGNRVLTIHQDRSDESIKMKMERGRPFPLFRGAPSRIILAHLPTYQLKNLLLNHPKEITEAGLGENWAEFRENLRIIRRRGYYVGSEIEKFLVGVAAPVYRAPNAVVGSYCVVRHKRDFSEKMLPEISGLAVKAAADISKRLQSLLEHGSKERPPSALPTPRLGR